MCFNDVDCSSSTPTITPTPATVCTSSTGNTASGPAGMTSYSWGITNGTITSATNAQSIIYTAGASGSVSLSLTVTAPNGCIASNSANVTINPFPAKPTIAPGGPTTLPTGGSVTLNSSSATGNQWYLNGNPIGGAINSSYVATSAGNYTVVVTIGGCSSPASDAITVTTCPSAPVVTNTNDSGAGSLRQAIFDACDGATISFDMNQVASPITLTSAGLVINKNLTITGPGANLLTVQRSTAGGTPQFGIFTINSGKTVGISGLTISNGNTSTGGGINNQGLLTLTGCTISGNSVNGTNSLGGGILNGSTAGAATLTITNSTISGNSTNGSNSIGGGIVNSTGNGTATLTITNSTLSGNSAIGGGNFGGGIYNSTTTGTATLTITNSTISRNSANGIGGGIYTTGSGTVTVKLSNTIVAGNTKSNGTTPDDINGTVDGTSSFNLIGTGGSGGLTNGVNNNQVGVANALLASLANYGGPTQTHAPLPGSPALNAGSNTLANSAGLTTDQRGAGFNRIFNGTVDIGAFESRGFTISATSGTPQSTVWGNAFGSALVATVSSALAEPVVGGQVIYTAPVSGPSATFTGGVTTLAVTINASNQATVNATANNIVGGPYNVSAGSAGIATPATFSLTNIKSNQTITFNGLGNKTFGDADFPVSATASSGLTVSFTGSGQCTISTNSVHLTGAGSCTITAKQAGDSNYNAAADVPRAFTIAQASTTTAVSSSANPSNLTQSVTFNATVSGPAGAGTPTGTVTFKDGAAIISCANPGGQTLNGGGVATCQTSALTVGTHTITAVYSGDTNFLTSTGTLSPNQVVNNLPLVSFSAVNYNVNESDGVVHLTVTRGGDTTVPFNVDYTTSDTGASTNCAALNTGLASSACDYTAFSGTLQFAANQITANIDIPINQDSYTEGPESFTATLSNATNGAVLVAAASTIITINDSAAPAPNVIDDNTVFVRQHYHDFLNRDADAGGLAFWVNGLNECSDPSKRSVGQAQSQCLEVRRILTSSAFFLSIEFMQTGTFVRSFYVAALNRPNPPSASDATADLPSFNEWLRDTQAVQRGVIVNQGNWQAMLDANRLVFMKDFVTRSEFVGLYPTTDTPTQYINKLYNHALGRTPTTTELNDGLSVFGGAATASDPTARGQALLEVTQAADFIARELPRAFVQFEYFGYLRRNPNGPPDNNFNGYNFWLNKLNLAGGDFLKAEMVKAFINSPEYRQRFGQ
jgi:Bacterial Ig-like domain (group 3)